MPSHGPSAARLPGGTYAEIQCANGSRFSHRIDPQIPDESAQLMALADEQIERARSAWRRALILRRAAWLIASQRKSS